MSEPHSVRFTDLWIKGRHQSGHCDLVINNEGFVATSPQEEDHVGKVIQRAVMIPWSSIKSLERVRGMVTWKLNINLRSGEEQWSITFTYELHPASVFAELENHFGNRTEFSTRRTAGWKPYIVPFSLAAFMFISGWWIYQNAEQQVEQLPFLGLLLYLGFGPLGFLAFCWIGGTISIGFGFWYSRLSKDKND